MSLEEEGEERTLTVNEQRVGLTSGEEEMLYCRTRIGGRSDRKVYDVEHTSLSQHEIEKIMQTDVDHISGIFGVEVRLQTRVCL